MLFLMSLSLSLAESKVSSVSFSESQLSPTATLEFASENMEQHKQLYTKMFLIWACIYSSDNDQQ